MFKFAVVIFTFIVCAAAKPGLIGGPAAIVSAAAPVVTATSSQYVARNHNGVASAPIVAPVAAPLIANTFAAYTAPVAAAPAYSAPLTYSAALTYPGPVVAKYAHSYSHHLPYTVPVAYARAPGAVLF